MAMSGSRQFRCLPSVVFPYRWSPYKISSIGSRDAVKRLETSGHTAYWRSFRNSTCSRASWFFFDSYHGQDFTTLVAAVLLVSNFIDKPNGFSLKLRLFQLEQGTGAY